MIESIKFGKIIIRMKLKNLLKIQNANFRMCFKLEIGNIKLVLLDLYFYNKNDLIYLF